MAVNQARVALYVDLVNGGRRTIEQIPADYREAVAAALKQQ